MQAGDIILVQGDGIISVGIELISRGSFSHSGIVTSEGTIIEATADGVVEVPIHYEHYAIYEVLGITSEEREKVVAAARKSLGTPYDYLQNVGFGINAIRKLIGLPIIANLLDLDNQVVCSALVDLSFEKAGIRLREDLEPGHITPIGITYSPKVHLLENHGLWEI
jgi:hypothetical protein